MFYVKFINESRLVDIIHTLRAKIIGEDWKYFTVFNVHRFTREQVWWKNKHKKLPQFQLIFVDKLFKYLSDCTQGVAHLQVWLIFGVYCKSFKKFFFFQNRCEIISDKPDTWKGLSLHWKNSWPYWVLHLLGFNNCAITSLSGKHLPLLLDWCTLHNFQMYYKWIKAWTWCWHSKWNWMTNLRSVLKIRDTGRNVSQKVDRSWILRLLFPYSYTI